MDPNIYTTQPLLSIRSLYKSFGSNRVLDNVNLNLVKGENKVILGRSGSGKSVLIKCIIGLLPIDNGSIEILGQPIPKFGTPDWDLVRKNVGFLFQSNALYDSMTVYENLAFPLRRLKRTLSIKEQSSLMNEALKEVGLEHTGEMMPAELSGGMKKRIALARTIILKPQIILYDEPTTGLDPITSKEIMTLISSIQKNHGTASLIISHDMNVVRECSDSVVMLVNGTCYAEDSYANLSHSKDKLIAPYFN